MPDFARHFDVLVVGAGPAGTAAAVRASEFGKRVGVVDDNPALGGQIWRGGQNSAAPEARFWFNKFGSSSATVFRQTRVFHQPAPGTLLAETPSDVLELTYSKLVLATGARERFLPFPGWTLPNVMGAGGLQALVKSGLPIERKRVVVAGSGPLLLAVAAYLREHGAEVPIVAEQAPRSKLIRFAASLWSQPSKAVQAVQLKRALRSTRFTASSWVLAGNGSDRVESVTLSIEGRVETISCDYLACGFHLVPNTELAALLGCRISSGFVEVNDLQETSVPSVYCAGEPTGIGGLDLSIIEGEIAGSAAAGQPSQAKTLFRKRDKLKPFVDRLDRTFALRRELRELPQADTILCRCEDVAFDRVRAYTSWRAAKLQTRCGMGPCQGRICGPATEFLFKWRPESVRPPVFPARFEALAQIGAGQPSEQFLGGQS